MFSARIKYEPNQTINGLTYLEEAEPHIQPNGAKPRQAKFRCYCGNEFIAQIGNVKNKRTNSCGCYKKKTTVARNTTHGLRNHKLYNVWYSMKVRCSNVRAAQYKDYGGRGIKVCDEWLNDFQKFYDFCIGNGWAEGLQIDRIDNDGDYSPDNCRFVTQAKNEQNKRNVKLDWDSVYEIRNAKLLIPRLTYQEIADAYQIHKTHVGRVLRTDSWQE